MYMDNNNHECPKKVNSDGIYFSVSLEEKKGIYIFKQVHLITTMLMKRPTANILDWSSIGSSNIQINTKQEHMKFIVITMGKHCIT